MKSDRLKAGGFNLGYGNESVMPVRMMRYLTDIMLEYPGLPVRQYLIYIGRSRLSMADGFAMPDFSYRDVPKKL